MASIFEWIEPWIVALALAVAMLASWGLGLLWGRCMPLEPGEEPVTKFIDASVVLLGLLLAFTFAIALGRHDQRRLAVVAESNAIGDFYTCASLLKEPNRSRLQDVIRDYAQHELDTPHEALSEADEKKAIQQCLDMFSGMTDIVKEAVAGDTPLAVSLTNTLNNVTSSNASRLAAYQETLPWSIVLLLFLSSLVPSFLIGEKQAAARRARLAEPLSFIVLVSLVMFVTLDLNQPRRGLIRVSQNSLARVIQSMAK